MTEMILWFRDRFPASPTKFSAVTGLGITSDATDLQSAPGFPMNPAGYPQPRYDAEKDRRAIDNPRHLAIMDAFLASVLDKWRPTTSAKLSKVSSSGFVFFETRQDYKAKLVAYCLDNVDDFLETFMLNPERCMKKYHTIPAYAIGRRHQADTQGKDREASSLRQALGIDGGRDIASKEVQQQKGKLTFDAQRERIVYAGPGGINYLCTLVINGFRDHYLNEFAFTYKLRGPEDLAQKISQKYLIGVDVKQFDQNFSETFADRMFDRLEQVIRPDLAASFRKLWRCPVYCPPPSLDRSATPGLWLGNPFNPKEDEINLGLPSGVAYNPDAGKWYGTYLLLCLLDDVYGDVLEVGIPQILKGAHPQYAILNASDDAVIMVNENRRFAQIRDLLKTGEASKYIKFDLEEPISFLGFVPRISSSGTQYDVLRNVVNYLKNRWVPERGIESPARKYWALGWLTKNEEFAHQEGIPEIQEFESYLVKKHLDSDLISCIRACAAQKQMTIGSADDAMFLQNPDYIHYRAINPSDELLAQLFITFSPDYQYDNIRRFINKEAL
jgi:hypothetical protein